MDRQSHVLLVVHTVVCDDAPLSVSDTHYYYYANFATVKNAAASSDQFSAQQEMYPLREPRAIDPSNMVTQCIRRNNSTNIQYINVCARNITCMMECDFSIYYYTTQSPLSVSNAKSIVPAQAANKQGRQRTTI